MKYSKEMSIPDLKSFRRVVEARCAFLKEIQLLLKSSADERWFNAIEAKVYKEVLESEENLVLRSLQVLQYDESDTNASAADTDTDASAKTMAREFLETLYQIGIKRLILHGWAPMTQGQISHYLTKVNPDMTVGAGCELFSHVDTGEVRDVLDIDVAGADTWHSSLLQCLNMLLSPGWSAGESDRPIKVWPVKVVDLDVESGISVLDVLETDAEAACDDTEKGGCTPTSVVVRKLVFGKYWKGINAEEADADVQTSMEMHSLPGVTFNDSWSSASLVGLGCFAIRRELQRRRLRSDVSSGPVRVLFLGLGGGLIPSSIGRYFHQEGQEFELELFAIEKSKKVIEVAKSWFGLATTDKEEELDCAKQSAYLGPGSQPKLDFSGESRHNLRKNRAASGKKEGDVSELGKIIPVRVWAMDYDPNTFKTQSAEFDVIISNLDSLDRRDDSLAFHAPLLRQLLNPKSGVFIVKECFRVNDSIAKKVNQFVTEGATLLQELANRESDASGRLERNTPVVQVQAFGELNLHDNEQKGSSDAGDKSDAAYIFMGHTDQNFPVVDQMGWDRLFLNEDSKKDGTIRTPKKEECAVNGGSLCGTPSTGTGDSPQGLDGADCNSPQDITHLPRCMPLQQAQRTKVVKIPAFFSSEEIQAVKDLGKDAADFAAAETRSDDKLKAWKVLFLNEHNRFAERLPELHRKVLSIVQRLDIEEGWGLHLGAACNVRVVEFHRQLAPSPGLSDVKHYDMDSLVTFDVLLNDEFEGGEFQTLEADGQLLNHCLEETLECGGHAYPVAGAGNRTVKAGDALVFVSHKYHCVSPVTAGERQVLVIEFWRYPFRGCGHRCELLSHDKICTKDSWSLAQKFARQKAEAKGTLTGQDDVRELSGSEQKEESDTPFPMLLGDCLREEMQDQEGNQCGVTRLLWQRYTANAREAVDLSKVKFVDETDDAWDCFG